MMKLNVFNSLRYKIGFNKQQVWNCSKIFYSTSNNQTSVDEGEVQRLTNLMNDWWDTRGSLQGLHSLNTLRVPFVIDGVAGPSSGEYKKNSLANKKILDIGCGGGILSESLAKYGANVTGIDPSYDLITLAQEHSKLNPEIVHNKPNYSSTTIEEHTEEYPEYYDAVVASEVIDHVTDKDLFLRSCVKSLKPGCRIFITGPNKTIFAKLHLIVYLEDIIKRLPKGLHDYNKFMSLKDLSAVLERYNCKVELVRGYIYYPRSDKWKWTKSNKVFYSVQAVKLK